MAGLRRGHPGLATKKDIDASNEAGHDGDIGAAASVLAKQSKISRLVSSAAVARHCFVAWLRIHRQREGKPRSTGNWQRFRISLQHCRLWREPVAYRL